jgi:pilus assembly protein Flp/PilA
MKTQFQMIKAMVRTFIRDEKGATMVEYALMVALIAVIALVAVKVLGTNASSTFSTAAASIAS